MQPSWVGLGLYPRLPILLPRPGGWGIASLYIYIYIYILDRTCCFQQQRLQCIMQNCRKASLHQICHHCLAICPEFCLEICQEFCPNLSNFAQIWKILSKFEQFCLILPNFEQFCPRLLIWPNLAEFGRIWPNLATVVRRIPKALAGPGTPILEGTRSWNSCIDVCAFYSKMCFLVNRYFFN